MIAPASVKQTMIAIDAHRARHALPPLKSHRTTQMLRAMRQRRPTGAAFIGADPINIRTVLQALPTRPTTLTAPNARRVPLPRITFEQARLRALMLLRIVTMLRPGEPASIKRSTITTARHPADPNRIIQTTRRSDTCAQRAPSRTCSCSSDACTSATPTTRSSPTASAASSAANDAHRSCAISCTALASRRRAARMHCGEPPTRC